MRNFLNIRLPFPAGRARTMRRGAVLAAYKLRPAGAFRIRGRIVTYPSRISLHLSARLVVHSRGGPGAVICVTYVRGLKPR